MHNTLVSSYSLDEFLSRDIKAPLQVCRIWLKTTEDRCKVVLGVHTSRALERDCVEGGFWMVSTESDSRWLAGFPWHIGTYSLSEHLVLDVREGDELFCWTSFGNDLRECCVSKQGRLMPGSPSGRGCGRRGAARWRFRQARSRTA